MEGRDPLAPGEERPLGVLEQVGAGDADADGPASSSRPSAAAPGSTPGLRAAIATYATRYPSPVATDRVGRSRKTRKAKMLRSIRVGVANRANWFA